MFSKNKELYNNLKNILNKKKFLKKQQGVDLLKVLFNTSKANKLTQVNLWNIFKSIKYLLRYLNDNKIDIIHSHDFKSNLYVSIIKIFKNINAVCTLHGWTRDTKIAFLYEILTKITLHKFQKIILVSKQT